MPACRLGTYYERLPGGGRSLFADGESLKGTQLTDLKAGLARAPCVRRAAELQIPLMSLASVWSIRAARAAWIAAGRSVRLSRRIPYALCRYVTFLLARGLWPAVAGLKGGAAAMLASFPPNIEPVEDDLCNLCL